MDLFKHGMKGPTRPAPSIPGFTVNRYSPVTNWNDDPFGADVFEPSPQFSLKKKPPPRPPPPKINRQPDVPNKPSHFIRKPTVLSSLLSRKTKPVGNFNHSPNVVSDISSQVDTNKIFPKCEPKNAPTGALIDFSSPPSSPTFTTRSSSDGLSIDSFGSDATTSTNHHNAFGGGNASQTESGFEDDFELFFTSRKLNKEDTLDDITTDPFSPPSVSNKAPSFKKPALNKDLYDASTILRACTPMNGPTIIRAKPARPKPPDNTAILKSTFGTNLPIVTMNVNTTTPIQKIGNGFADNFESKPFSWDSGSSSERESPEREPSPPMPTVPPPPPPPEASDDDDLPVVWSEDCLNMGSAELEQEPYAIALFDYHTDHSEDLHFSANMKIKLVRRVNDEWLYGRLKSGVEGLFPASFVEIKVPLPSEAPARSPYIGTAVALYSLATSHPGDLAFAAGDTVRVTHKLNDEWYFGECNGRKGQFPYNYVQLS